MRAARKTAVKMRFAAVRLRRKIQEGSDIAGSAGPKGLPETGEGLGVAGITEPGCSIGDEVEGDGCGDGTEQQGGHASLGECFPRKKTRVSASKVVRNTAGLEVWPMPSGKVTAHTPSGMANPRQPVASRAPQKKRAARGWKFGRVSGKCAPESAECNQKTDN